jgi:hypothetical protein
VIYICKRRCQGEGIKEERHSGRRMRTEEKERCGVWSGMYECNCGWEEGKRGEDIEDGMRRHRPLSTLRADSTILAACSRRRVCDEGSALGGTLPGQHAGAR